ncbi:MAG: hypothetical protein XD95_0146 [Microgenomates bacterium 39_7]|nr:MAG: hypothetical protein XD95_0146 [Microgenomates bacterium 39_7]
MENQPDSNPQNSQHLNSASVNPDISPEQKMSLLFPVLITLLISAVVFGLGGFYLGKKSFTVFNTQVSENKAKEQVEQPTPSPILKTTNSQTLLDITDLLTNGEFKPVDRQTMWWVSDDGWSILVDNSETIALFRAKAHSELQDPKSETSKIVETVSSYFANQGYSQNRNNSSDNVTDDAYYDFIRGFENNNEKCLLLVKPDESYYQDENKQMVAVPNIVVSCSNSSSVDASYNKQINYLKAMNDRKAVIYIQEETDSAAKANVNWRRTGAFALFSKKNGNWEMIYLGQDRPSCQLLEEYDFPKKIHDSCF